MGTNRKADGELHGAGLKLITEPINNKLNYYDLGYRLIRTYWGNGYASEAAKSSIQYGFESLLLTEIYGMTEASNLASVKILGRAGLCNL
jgi:ribosomal-protein-alanine N-acetyltransferase